MKKKLYELLSKYELFPNKRLGQNFLIDNNNLNKIVKAAVLKKTDNVLEIGPGLGFLTDELAKRVKKVVAVEKDRKLYDFLSSRQGIHSMPLKIINADILKLPFKTLKEEFNNKQYKIVANLPYQITARFFKKFLQADYQPVEMVVMIQKEVAERIVETRRGASSLLAVSIQFFCEPKILFKVGKNCFHPKPKVDSAVIRLANIRKDKHDVNVDKFFKVVKQGFANKRKQLKNNLNIETAVLQKLGLKENVRAQELSVDDWVRLVCSL